MSERYHQILPEGSLEFFRGIPRKLGEFVTRTFLSPFPLDTFESPLDEPVEPVTDWVETPKHLICPDVAGRDISRGWTDQGEYLEREV